MVFLDAKVEPIIDEKTVFVDDSELPQTETLVDSSV
jgi:hypothetical protein